MEEETKAILETIDDSTLDRNDDWSDVVREIDCLKDRWRKIGCNLRVKPEKIKEIARDHPQDSETCLSEVVLEWLRGNYNTARFGEPSWKMLARAVVELDRDLFKRIAKRHNYKISLMESLATAVNQSTQLILGTGSLTTNGTRSTSPRFSNTRKPNTVFLSSLPENKLPMVTVFLILSSGVLFLVNENQHLKADLSLHLKDSTQWLEMGNILVEQDIVNKEESIAEDTLELKVIDAEKERLEQELIDKEKQIDDLEKELNYFKVRAIFYSQRDKESGIQIARCEQKIAQLNTSKEELKSKLDELITESKHLKERLRLKEDTIRDLEVDLSRLREMRDDFSKTLETKKYLHNLQQEVLSELEQKVRDFRTKIEEQKNVINSLVHDRDTLKTVRDELETHWHSERTILTVEIEELNAKIQEHNSTIWRLQQERDAASNHELENKILRLEVDELYNEEDQLEDNLRLSKQTIEELKTSLKQEGDTLKTVRDDFENSTAAYEEKIANLSLMIANLTQERNVLEEKIVSLHQSKENLMEEKSNVIWKCTKHLKDWELAFSLLKQEYGPCDENVLDKQLHSTSASEREDLLTLLRNVQEQERRLSKDLEKIKAFKEELMQPYNAEQVTSFEELQHATKKPRSAKRTFS